MTKTNSEGWECNDRQVCDGNRQMQYFAKKKIWPELELNSHVRTAGGSRDPGRTIRSLSGGFNSGQSGYGLEHGRSSA